MPKLIQFRKELIQNIVLVAGKPVPFLPLAGNRGVIQLDEEKPADVPIITALNDYAERRKFGVVKITAEEYEAASKKVLSLQPSTKRKLEKLKVMQPLLKPKSPSPEKAAPAASAEEVKALEQYRKDFGRGVQEAKNGQQKQQSTNEAYNAGYASIHGTPPNPVRTNAGEPLPSGGASENPPAFVPRTVPKPDADKQPTK